MDITYIVGRNLIDGMANNISKYVALNDFLLLEYEFNKSGQVTDLLSEGISSVVANTVLGRKQYFNQGSLGVLNNDLILNSQPLSANRSSWYITDSEDTSEYWNFFDSSALIGQTSYPFDTVKVHIVSGYNFDDIPGFLLQVQAKDASNNLVDLSNFTWINQVLGGGVLKFSPNALLLGNRYYDKYIEFRIPSVQELGGDTISALGQALSIKALSDVYFSYSTIPDIDGDNYIVAENISLQLPVSSQADNFNAFIAESTAGDFIEFYATWNNKIIGESMGDIESGRIRLFTSSNPNDNFEEFADIYGAGAQKWVIMHELYVYEHIPGNSLLTQQYVFTQDSNFVLPNYFRPVIRNSDIASTYTINYICRLTNRMDGTQIIRKASFSSADPKKYGRRFQRLNVDNYIPYKVFNRIDGEASTIVQGITGERTRFVKVYYDTTNVLLSVDNEVLPQGTGPLFLKRSDGLYKFSFQRLNENAEDEMENVDLSGVFNYALSFTLDDDRKIEVIPTFSQNMNTVLGELEFKISEEQALRLLKQSNNTYSIVVKNPDGSKYTFYEGLYFPLTKEEEISNRINKLSAANEVVERSISIERENTRLKKENTDLRRSAGLNTRKIDPGDAERLER